MLSPKVIGIEVQISFNFSMWVQGVVVMSILFSKSMKQNWVHSEKNIPKLSENAISAISWLLLIKWVMRRKTYLNALRSTCSSDHLSESVLCALQYILPLSKVSYELKAIFLSSLFFTIHTWLLLMSNRRHDIGISFDVTSRWHMFAIS